MKAFLQNRKNNKGVTQLSFSVEESKQLYWENSHEFRYNGEMYDVIEKKSGKAQIIIRCVSNTKETALLNEYQKNNKRNASNSIIAQLITAQFVLPVDYSLKQPESIIRKNFADRSSSLQDIVSPVIPRPPCGIC